LKNEPGWSRLNRRWNASRQHPMTSTALCGWMIQTVMASPPNSLQGSRKLLIFSGHNSMKVSSLSKRKSTSNLRFLLILLASCQKTWRFFSGRNRK
jgi:hypothetical protein